ncbi:MAG: hypothetical protein HUU34_15590 [Saprospiraceae bacterium]|nr:hypothetical protein [Saprospiraceae bacterium]
MRKELILELFQKFEIEHHFADVGKMVDISNGTQRRGYDFALTRYARHLAGDVKKLERRLKAEQKKALQKPEKLTLPTTEEKEGEL